MELGTSRLSIAAGSGFVARHGTVVLLVDPTGDRHDEVVDELFSLVSGLQAQGSDVVRRIGALVTSHAAADVPPFGALVQDGDDLVAVLSGEVSLTVTSAGTDLVVEGKDASTFVERRLRGGADKLWLAAAGAVDPDARSSLSGGVVRGSGVLLTPGAQPGESVESAAEPVEPREPALQPLAEHGERTPASEASGTAPAFESIDLFDEPEPPTELVPTLNPDATARRPVPTVDDAAIEAAQAQGVEEATPTLVEGIYCSRGHFNSPEQVFCNHCGISMVQQTHNRVRGPRPPLGVLVSDDGAVFSLAQDFVVGREPETDPEVVNGTAQPLTLADPELGLSRVHARILLDGWEVRVEDAGSANGTFVAVDGGEWTRLEPGRPTTVKPGSAIALGARILSFETHQRS